MCLAYVWNFDCDNEVRLGSYDITVAPVSHSMQLNAKLINYYLRKLVEI